jgi:hypothetical protein
MLRALVGLVFLKRILGISWGASNGGFLTEKFQSLYFKIYLDWAF